MTSTAARNAARAIFFTRGFFSAFSTTTTKDLLTRRPTEIEKEEVRHELVALALTALD